MMKKKEKLDITIKIINWNLDQQLRNCIDSILETIKNVSYEVFIIDNNSKFIDFDRIIKDYKEYSQLKFIKNKKNKGGLASNDIQHLLKGRYLLILGPDTIVKKNTIKNLVGFMDKTKDAGGASAKLILPDGSQQIFQHRSWDLTMSFYNTFLGNIIDYFLFNKNKIKSYLSYNINMNELCIVDKCPGACLVIRPELLINDGYIVDQQFPFFFNEVDMCKRITDKGYKIYIVPSAEIEHDKWSSYKKANSSWKNKEFKKAMIKYFRKHFPKKVKIIKIILIISELNLLFLSPFLVFKKRYRFNKKNIKTSLEIMGGISKW